MINFKSRAMCGLSKNKSILKFRTIYDCGMCLVTFSKWLWIITVYTKAAQNWVNSSRQYFHSFTSIISFSQQKTKIIPPKWPHLYTKIPERSFCFLKRVLRNNIAFALHTKCHHFHQFQKGRCVIHQGGTININIKSGFSCKN